MAARDDALAFASAQDVGDVGGAEPLTDARHRRQNFSRDGGRIAHRLQFAQTEIARAAVGLAESFAEVADQALVPAADAARIALHVAQQRALRVGQFPVLLEHAAPADEIARGVGEDTFGLETVASGTSGFLLVMLERLRRTGV